MISRKMLRRAAFRLADALEAAAGALRERAEYRGRRRPFAFPTASEIFFEAMQRETLRRYAKDLAFLKPGEWERVAAFPGEVKIKRIEPKEIHVTRLDSPGYVTGAPYRRNAEGSEWME